MAGKGKAGKGKAAPQADLPIYAEYFDGTWIKEGAAVTYDVQGAAKRVIFDDNKDNKSYRFEATSADSCMMVINDKTHTGTLVNEDTVEWSTGSTWTRPGFGGTWVKEDTGATYDVQPGRNKVQFDDDKEYEFDVTGADSCVMTIGGKQHQGKLMNPNTLKWSNGSTWLKPNFGGRWQKDGTKASYFLNPAADSVTFDDGVKYEFEVLKLSECKMVINGKAHQGRLKDGKIEWSNGSTWSRLSGGGSQAAAADADRGIPFNQEQLQALGVMKPTSGRFYRDMVGVRAEAEPRSFASRYDQVAPPKPAGYPAGAPMPGSSPPGDQQRSVFGCPCCGRLFHVYVEGGQYHAVVGKGLESVRVQLQPGQQ